MIHFRKEGETVRYGFNFYPLGDKNSIGFYLKYWHDRVFIFRYSKKAKHWIFHFIKSSPIPDWDK